MLEGDVLFAVSLFSCGFSLVIRSVDIPSLRSSIATERLIAPFPTGALDDVVGYSSIHLYDWKYVFHEALSRKHVMQATANRGSLLPNPISSLSGTRNILAITINNLTSTQITTGLRLPHAPNAEYKDPQSSVI